MEASLATALLVAAALAILFRRPGWFSPELIGAPAREGCALLRTSAEPDGGPGAEVPSPGAHGWGSPRGLVWAVAGTAVARLALWATLGA